MPDHALQRHDLVWLGPRAADLARAAGPCTVDAPAATRLLAEWIAAGRPLIVARQDAGTVHKQIRLGLALPPALGKHRLAFVVPPGAIVRRSSPPALDAEAVAALPEAWRPAVAALLHLPPIRVLGPRLLGSAGMQLASGLDCLGPGSDLDLLLAPPTWPEASAALRALHALEGTHLPRIDGEIRNPAGDAVAWRELAANPVQILVKSFDAVRLIDRAAFAASFPVPVGAAA